MKTSLAPGIQVVTDYLPKAGLNKPLDKLGFQLVGYGCTTCIGNSGPLPETVAKAVTDGDLVAAPCFRAIEISKAACMSRCGRTISPRRCWSSPTRWRAR